MDGDKGLYAKRDAQGVVYYTGDQEDTCQISSVARDVICALLAEDVTYACKRNVGPWKLLVMLESKWVVSGTRPGSQSADSITYTNDENGEQIGWAIYDSSDEQSDSIRLYLYVSQDAKQSDRPTWVFGWGEVAW